MFDNFIRFMRRANREGNGFIRSMALGLILVGMFLYPIYNM